MPRTTLLAARTAGVALAGLATALTAPALPVHAVGGPSDQYPAAAVPPAKTDYLSISVTRSGDPQQNRTYSLFCHPAGGTHPQPERACAVLDSADLGTSPQEDGGAVPTDRTRHAPYGGPFGPVPENALCTMVDGGPATARIRGVWRGRPVDARFDRSNGCEMSRWDRLVPALPALKGPHTRSQLR
ncbi:SSI family serine proteinase inhibitor [Streptomyces sp. TR06-5]|uniref:SSI family serine proteinase inhibitor n=1 Tax=unclassified Streptomyces TaxID=2593676 RepID=UPI0039A12E19